MKNSYSGAWRKGEECTCSVCTQLNTRIISKSGLASQSIPRAVVKRAASVSALSGKWYQKGYLHTKWKSYKSNCKDSLTLLLFIDCWTAPVLNPPLLIHWLLQGRKVTKCCLLRVLTLDRKADLFNIPLHNNAYKIKNEKV